MSNAKLEGDSLKTNYQSQEKVMFSEASVSHSFQGGGYDVTSYLVPYIPSRRGRWPLQQTACISLDCILVTKLCFQLCLSVCHSVGGAHGTITHDVLDITIEGSLFEMLKLVQLGPHCAGTPNLPYPDIFKLVHYEAQAGSWHSTGMLSCRKHNCK